MSLLYADSSALVGAYLPDEREHALLRALLLEGRESVVTSMLARLEVASALIAAARAGRLSGPRAMLDRFDASCEEGVITLIQFDSERILPRALDVIFDHRLRTLDAVHLAVLLEDVLKLAGGEDVVLVTRDAVQAAAARALGLDVR